MKKNNFIKSTIILIIGGFITKILGLIIKIVLSRNITTETLGTYMMIMPTFMLLITLAQLGFPIAISKLVAEEKYNNKKIVFSSIPIILLLNIILLIIIVIISQPFATTILNNKNLKNPLIYIGLVLPFISISSILRSYFFGKQKMIPHVISNITEDIIRLLTLIIGLPLITKKGLYPTVNFIILTNIISEITSIVILLFFLPKKITIKKEYFIPNKQINNILKIGIPSTSSRIIGCISYFLEPIIITNILAKVGYSNYLITTEYGIITGYVMPLLLLPSFFTSAISNALLPVVSNSYSNKNYKYTRKKIKQAILFSLLIGIPSTILFLLFPTQLLNLIYKTNEGTKYLKILAPIFLLHYIQTPLTSSLQAMNKAKIAMKATLIGSILKIIILTTTLPLKIGLWPLIISISVNTIYITLHHINKIKKILK